MKNQVIEHQSSAVAVIVKAKDEKNFVWTESSTALSFSSVGAGFYLQHRCRPGQVISLMLPLNKNLRRYDQDKELYRVWGLIQHCNSVSNKDFSGYHIGVAFVGKETPSGYNENPQQSYRISGMGANGLWKIEPASASFIARKFQRFRLSLKVNLSFFDEQDNSLKNEECTTLNISRGGAAVFSNLPVNVGDRIMFSSKFSDSSLEAIVRRRNDEGAATVLNLEFIGTEFPIENINFDAEFVAGSAPVTSSKQNVTVQKSVSLNAQEKPSAAKINLLFDDSDSILEISAFETYSPNTEFEEFELDFFPKFELPEIRKSPKAIETEMPQMACLVNNESLPQKKLKNRKARKKAAREAKKKMPTILA